MTLPRDCGICTAEVVWLKEGPMVFCKSFPCSLLLFYYESKLSHIVSYLSVLFEPGQLSLLVCPGQCLGNVCHAAHGSSISVLFACLLG